MTSLPSSRSDHQLLTQMQAANDLVEGLVTLSTQSTEDPAFDPLDRPQAIAQALVQGMVSRLGAASAQVWFYDSSDQAFYSSALAGLVSPAQTQLHRLHATHDPLGPVVQRGEPLLSNAPADEPWMLAPDWVRQQGLRSFSAYPITLGRQPVGALAIFSRHPLNSEFLEVLKFICSYAASAVVNARQTAQLQHQASRDGLIRQVSQQLRRSLDSTTMGQTLVEQVGRALRVDRCDFLHLPWPTFSDPDQGMSAPTQAPEIVTSYVAAPAADGGAHPTQVTSIYHLLLSQADLLAQLQIHQCLTVMEGHPLSPQLQAVGFSRILIVPLLLQQHYREEVLGFLSLVHHRSHSIPEAEIELVQAIATQAALALDNAQLYERTRQQGEREALLNRITNTVHQSLNWDQIVSTAMQAIQETLNLSRCCFFAVIDHGQAVLATHESCLPDLELAAGPYVLPDFGPFFEQIEGGEIVQMSDLDLEGELPEAGRRILRHLQIQAGVLIPVQPDRSQGVDEVGAIRETEPGDVLRQPDLAAAPEPQQKGLIGLVGAFKQTPYGWKAEEVELLRSVASQLAIALTKAQLFDHAQQQTERLSLLHDMTAVIRSSLEPTTLFQAITQQIGAAFEVDVCTLALWHPQDTFLRPVGIYAPRLTPDQLEEMLPGLRVLADHPQGSLWGEQVLIASQDLPRSTQARLRSGTQLLLAARAPVILADLDSPVAEMEQGVKRLGHLEPSSVGVLLVPLWQGEDLIGCLCLKRLRQGQLWQEADLQLAEAVAEQAAIAIAQARLLTQTQDQAEQASLLNRMTDRIRYSLNLDEILQAAVEEVGRALEAGRAQFVFVTPQDRTVICRHGYAQPGIDCWMNRQLPMQQSLLREAQSEPILVRGWSDLESFDPSVRQELRRAQVRSILLACLNLGGDQYGILSVHDCGVELDDLEERTSPSPERQHRSWSNADHHLLQRVAEQLVIAINQSRLYEKTQQQARREILLNEITNQIRTSLDPKQVLQSIIQALASTLELKRCEISLYRRESNTNPPSPGSSTDSTLVWSNGTFSRRAGSSERETLLNRHRRLGEGIPAWTPATDPAPSQDFLAQVKQMLAFHHAFQREQTESPPQPEATWMRPELIDVLRQGEPLVINQGQPPHDMALPAGAWTTLQTFFQVNAVRSLALIPILQSGELLGTIAMLLLHTDGPRQFQPDEISLAMAVAEQAGIALQQAQLYEQTRISALRESLLRQLAQQLTSTYDPRQVIQTALEGMANALQVDRCDFVALSKPYKTTSSLPVAVPFAPPPTEADPEAADPTDTDPSAMGLRIFQEFRRLETSQSRRGQTLPADLSWLILLDCYGRHDSLLIEDVISFPLPPQTRKNLLAHQIRGVLCVPVMTDNTTVAGVLCAFVPPDDDEEDLTDRLSRQTQEANPPYEQRPFCNADSELVQALADITAVALQRAQFYEQTKDQEATAAAIRGLTEGREAESRRLAADLHDQTLADLGALSRQLQHLATEGSLPTADRREVEQMNTQLGETIMDLRGIVEDLQPTAMRAFTFGSALRSLLERAAQRSSVPLVTRFDDRSASLVDRLDSVTQSTLFRIVQEALNNVVKHAQARRIDIILAPVIVDEAGEVQRLNSAETLPDPYALHLPEEPTYTHLEIKIIDDGVGMPQDPQQVGRHGLLNMRYRAEMIRAQVAWRGRRSGSGTVVQILIPIP